MSSTSVAYSDADVTPDAKVTLDADVTPDAKVSLAAAESAELTRKRDRDEEPDDVKIARLKDELKASQDEQVILQEVIKNLEPKFKIAYLEGQLAGWQKENDDLRRIISRAPGGRVDN